MLKDILSLFFPQICVGCNQPIHKPEWAICLYCRKSLPATKYYQQENNSVTQLLREKCQVSHAFSFYFFEQNSRVQNLIHALKYKGITSIGSDFGKIIGEHIKHEKRYQFVDFVIPVPLHRSKELSRGYNQCDFIAREMALKLNAKFTSEGVERVKPTESQTRKSHFERFQNSIQIFRVVEPKIFENKNILLVDDVITTGATLASLVNEFNGISNCTIQVATIASTSP